MRPQPKARLSISNECCALLYVLMAASNLVRANRSSAYKLVSAPKRVLNDADFLSNISCGDWFALSSNLSVAGSTLGKREMIVLAKVSFPSCNAILNLSQTSSLVNSPVFFSVSNS